MNRIDIIRSLAKKCGVQDSDAKTFFEITLHLITEKISPGDAVSIEGIGLFQLRKGKIRNFNPAHKEEFVIQNVIVYHEDKSSAGKNREQLLFNVPNSLRTDDLKGPDSHFSLSFGKPVIPLKGTAHSDFFMPPNAQELRHLFYSKAERLIGSSQIIPKDENTDEFLIIGPGKTKPPVEYTGKSPRIHYKDDFNEEDELAKKIELESLLDLPSENKSNLPAEEKEKNKAEKDIADDLKKDNPLIVKSKDATIITEPIDESSKFERVRTVLKDEGSEEKRKTSEKDNEDFKRAGNKGFSTVKKDFTPSEELNSAKDKIPLKTPRIERKKSRQPMDDLYEEDKVKQHSYSLRRSKAGIIIIFAIMVVSVALAVLYYSPFFRGDEKSEVLSAGGPIITPLIIERSFDIPVSYPYNKNESNLAAFDPVSITPMAQIEEATVETVNKQDAPVVGNNERGSISPVKIREYIYKYGETFVVQVSSWKSFSKAESEVKRFNSLGHKAFLEPATLQEKGTYYRVRVGNFNTVEEAITFLNKNF